MIYFVLICIFKLLMSDIFILSLYLQIQNGCDIDNNINQFCMKKLSVIPVYEFMQIRQQTNGGYGPVALNQFRKQLKPNKCNVETSVACVANAFHVFSREKSIQDPFVAQ